MFRALFLFTLLTACAQFPQVDAAAPSDIPPRPAYLTPSELAAANALAADIAPASSDPAAEALRARADDLRAR